MNPISGAGASAIPGIALPSGIGSGPQPRNVREAAAQFESLLIEQILKTAQQETEESSTGDDKSSATAVEFGTQYMAQAIASKGGLGLANLIAKGLETAAAREQASAAPAVKEATRSNPSNPEAALGDSPRKDL